MAEPGSIEQHHTVTVVGFIGDLIEHVSHYDAEHKPSAVKWAGKLRNQRGRGGTGKRFTSVRVLTTDKQWHAAWAAHDAARAAARRGGC